MQGFWLSQLCSWTPQIGGKRQIWHDKPWFVDGFPWFSVFTAHYMFRWAIMMIWSPLRGTMYVVTRMFAYLIESLSLIIAPTTHPSQPSDFLRPTWSHSWTQKVAFYIVGRQNYRVKCLCQILMISSFVMRCGRWDRLWCHHESLLSDHLLHFFCSSAVQNDHTGNGGGSFTRTRILPYQAIYMHFPSSLQFTTLHKKHRWMKYLILTIMFCLYYSHVDNMLSVRIFGWTMCIMPPIILHFHIPLGGSKKCTRQ